MSTKCISTGGYPVEVATPGDISGGGDITSSQITDATTVGKAVLTAADAAAARTAIGAGTSSLVIGTTSTTAMAGNAAATTSVIGGVKKMAAQADSTATDVAGLVTDFNALLAKARAAGLI
ncbi:head fiber protein [Escherichia coli]